MLEHTLLVTRRALSEDFDLGSEFVGLDVKLLLIELVEQRLRIGGVASRGGSGSLE